MTDGPAPSEVETRIERDMIRFDVNQRKLEAEISDEEIARIDSDPARRKSPEITIRGAVLAALPGEFPGTTFS